MIVSIVGARPEFIQCHTMALALGDKHTLVHTGQHYDYQMSQVFFDELGLPRPAYYLEVGPESHNRQIGLMLLKLEAALTALKPDWVLVYGDTNTTLAGALAAVKLGIPVAHIEAGLRSFNRAMPEEANRVMVDHIATLLCSPTQTALNNLANEGLTGQWVGDVAYDAYLRFIGVARQKSTILDRLNLRTKDYCLATIHRAGAKVPELVEKLKALQETVIFPVHPATRKALPDTEGLRLIEPVGYLDMLVLEENARLILTDSGGVQKEAYFAGVPCVTMRDETEWTETLKTGWNRLNYFEYYRAPTYHPDIFGNGKAGERIGRLL